MNGHESIFKPKYCVGGICPEWCYSLMHLVDTGKNVKGHYDYCRKSMI